MLGTPRRRRHPVAVAAAALLLVGVPAGCGGDEPAEDADASENPSATPSPDDQPAAEPAAEQAEVEGGAPEKPRRLRDDQGSRRAFARHVVDSWTYALRTNQAAAVVRLGPKARPCQGCAELRTELRKRDRQGWYVDLPDVRVRSITVRPGEEPRTFVARARVDIPESTSYFEDGSFRNDNRARRNADFEVRMRLERNDYTLLAFRLR
jgi:hypothetical protein